MGEAGGRRAPVKARVLESAAAVRSRAALVPKVGIILGTGLNRLADEVSSPTVVRYADIPHFPEPTVASHEGRLVLGTIGRRPVVLMQGRFHYYEGFDLDQVTHPVRVMKELGVETLVVSNASGGVNPLFRTGDICVITDHVNLTGHNPLRGPNDDSLGPRFPDMHAVYTPALVELAARTALELGLPVQRGVYAWVTGPNLETAAEYRWVRTIGADLVGMSTVPEVIVARHAGLRVLGLSVVTDMGLPDALKPVDLPEVLRVAAEAEPKLTRLMVGVLERM
ncbi:MAG: purine-nucleoside phosphorylase [bacterium]